LIADDGVMAGFDFELHGSEMFDGDFHDVSGSGAHRGAGNEGAG
jgi:hypothetical protein